MSQPNTIDDARAFPGVAMSLQPHGAIDVTPVGADYQTTFSLGPIPQSLSDQLATACLWFWRKRSRCLGIVLLLDPKNQKWSATIPAQRSSARSACWSVARRDLPGVDPGAFLAGSFQSRILSKGEEPADCPPPHDGLHLVMVIGPEMAGLFAFLRCDGVTRPVPISDVVFEDVGPMVLAAADRIELI